MQPHAFLPPETLGNERVRCGSGVLSPIDLFSWIERDPFLKDVVQANNEVMTSQISEKTSTTSENTFKPWTTKKPATFVDNKLDFSSTIRSLPEVSQNSQTEEI